MATHSSPPIAALFLVTFDQKVGYTITWKRHIPELDLNGVEYQSLPSGLHSVASDLVYFLHGSYAGISAFAQAEADAQHRNATFAAVGALTSSSGGLGRAWTLAESLKQLAGTLVSSPDEVAPLEAFWSRNGGAKGGDVTSPGREPGPSRAKRRRASSDAAALFRAEGSLSPDHPALSIGGMLNVFGPLIFPLHRAALLRRRILFLGQPPVRRNCEFVYALSILANLPTSSKEALPEASERLHRTRPLFNVGISDMSRLEDKDNSGWLASTTDNIIGEKKQLYDLLVELPLITAKSGAKSWPKIRDSDGQVVKSSQRDLRRYQALRRQLGRLKGRSDDSLHHDDEDEHDEDGLQDGDDDDSEEAPLVRQTRTHTNTGDGINTDYVSAELVEPDSWTALAYRSFIWWASAGERDVWESQEAAVDSELLQDLPTSNGTVDRRSPANGGLGGDAAKDVYGSITGHIAFFHRLTNLFIQRLASVLEEADDQTDEGDEEDVVSIPAEEICQMGLDTWSKNDYDFVEGMVKLYFDREARIVDDGVRLCGVRVC